VKKRLKQDKGYALLQLKQREFGRASELVKQMYYTLPLDVRKHGLFGKLTGKAVRMLRAGIGPEEVKERLLQEWMPKHARVEEVAPISLVQQPIDVTPAAQTTKRKAATRGFSKWQVSTNGILYKERAYEQVVVDMPGAASDPCLKNGLCLPCVFNGLALLTKDKGG
jgi:hypothetical protein